MHESNHALQEQCILTDENVDRHFSAMLQVENARDDNGRLYNYIQPDADRDYEYNVLYYLQCNELDSNNQAASFMLSQQNRYGHEEGYHNYIQERTHYFCNINSAIDNYRENRQNLQRSQINEAYTRGDISDKQYELLSAHISDDRYEDVAVKECRTIAGEVNELNNKFNAELEISKSAQSEYLGSVCDGVQVAFVDGSEKVSPNNITADSPNDYLGTTKNMSNKTYSNSFVASKTSEMEQSL